MGDWSESQALGIRPDPALIVTNEKLACPKDRPRAQKSSCKRRDYQRGQKEITMGSVAIPKVPPDHQGLGRGRFEWNPQKCEFLFRFEALVETWHPQVGSDQLRYLGQRKRVSWREDSGRAGLPIQDHPEPVILRLSGVRAPPVFLLQVSFFVLSAK